MPRATGKFFKKQTEASAVKTRITSNYFSSWATIALPRAGGQAIAYIDMFCGPGRYDSGENSTPLVILEKALAKPILTQRLVTIFNDEKVSLIRKLKKNIENFPGIERLTHKPVTMNTTIGPETERYFLENSTVPALTFIDPFGYTGLTRDLIKGVTKNFLCDCIFFFSYTGVNRALSTGTFSDRMESIFGRTRAAQLETELSDIGSRRGQAIVREGLIVHALTKALEEIHNRYVRWFRFKKGSRTSHMLVFVSKHALGYRLMNEIMGTEGFRDEKGIPHYTYYDKPPPKRQLFYPEFDALKEALLTTYAGKTITRRQIYEEHSVRKNYISSNYREALLELDSEDRITVNKPRSKRQRGGETTLGEDIPISFPKK